METLKLRRFLAHAAPRFITLHLTPCPSTNTVFELEYGVQRIERKDPRQGARLRSWLDDVVLASFADQILPIDQTVARTAANFHVPDPVPVPDSLIAATAHVYGLTLVTRNTTYFERTGVSILNPCR